MPLCLCVGFFSLEDKDNQSARFCLEEIRCVPPAKSDKRYPADLQIKV